jgi:hypothetical protein
MEHGLDRDYIKTRLGMPNKLLMRAWNDNRRDALIKYIQLQRLLQLKQFQKLPRRLWEDSMLNIETLKPLFSNCFHVPSKITGLIK